MGRVAVRPDHKYITKLLPEIPPSLCGCTKKSCTNTIQIHTQIQNKHNLYHQKKVARNLVRSICIKYIDICIWFEFALRVKTEFAGSRTKILTHSNSTYEEEKKQIVAKLLGGDHRMVSIHGGNGLPKVLNVAANFCLSPFAELLPPFCLNPILSCAGLKNETMKLKGLTVTRLK